MTLSTRSRRLTVLAALVLIATACGGSSDGDDADDTTTSGTAQPSATSAAASNGSGGGSSSGSGDFMTVFGLPPGDSVETDWSPYEYREDEFGTYEAVVFEVTGATLDEIISHYESTLPSMGYDVGPRLELGDSIAINITDPANPATTAVIQAGPTDDVITVNQNKTVPVGDATTSSTTSPPVTASSGAAGPGGQHHTVDGSTVTIDWGDLPSTPFFAPANQANDPFFHIHTNPATDGIFLAFEMYTDWGQAWTGQTGTFEISCSNPATSTGICPYYDPDGPGPEPVKGGDFATTGMMTINQLDAGGYDIEVTELVFSDGTSFEPFTMVG